MALTSAQKTTLKAAINADPVLSAFPNTADGAFAIAAALNLPAVPDYYVWRTAVLVTEIMQNGFDWTRVDNLTVGKARIWEFMTAAGTLNPSQPNVRAGFESCFSVEAGDQATRQAIYDHCVQKASRAEKIFAAGSGAGTAPTHHGVGPDTMTFTGNLSFQDVQDARAS